MPITVAELMERLHKPVTVHIEQHGDIELRAMLDDDVRFINELLGQDLVARRFAAEVIQHQIQKPQPDLAVIELWDDQVLLSVVAAWAQEELDKDAMSESLTSFEAFRQVCARVIPEAIERLQNSIKELAELAKPFITSMSGISKFNLGFLGGYNYDRFADLKSAINPQILPDWAKEWKSVVGMGIGAHWAEQLTRIPNIGLSEEWTKNISFLSDDFLKQPLWESGRLHALLPDFPKPILSDISETVKGLLGSITGIDSVLGQATDSWLTTFPGFRVGQIFPALPDFSSWEPRIKRWQEACDILTEAGYGFLTPVWNVLVIAKYATASSKLRQANITKVLVRLTRHDDFGSNLGNTMQGSSLLAKRWPIVAKAYEAHKRGEYLLSIPPLLAQVEGVLTDLMILRNEIAPKRGKFYAKGDDGNIKVNKRGDLVEVQTLGSKIDHSRFNDHDLLNEVKHLFLNHLIKERNAILHGRHTRYGTAKLSTQTLLLFYMLACELAGIESGEVSE